MESKIIDGSFAGDSCRTYMTSLRYNYIHICGSVLISELHVLSSATCVILFEDREPEYKGLDVAVGSTHLDINVIFYGVIHIYVHEFYRLNKLTYSPHDISVITVSS